MSVFVGKSFDMIEECLVSTVVEEQVFEVLHEQSLRSLSTAYDDECGQHSILQPRLRLHYTSRRYSRLLSILSVTRSWKSRHGQRSTL